MLDDIKTIQVSSDSLSDVTRTIGILMPRSRVSVKTHSGITILTPTWHRWLPVVNCLAIGLLHLAPLIIGGFVFSETSPEKTELILRAIPLAVFSLFWFWLAVSQILRYAKISWQNNSSELQLCYRRLLSSRKLNLSSEGLAVRMFFYYKTDKSNIRAKYGTAMLSLIRVDQPDDELLIASAKDKKAIEQAFRSLKDFLGHGVDETVVEEPDPTSDLLIFGIEGLRWNDLAYKTRTKKPFFDSMSTKKIGIKVAADDTVFKLYWTRWLILLLLVPMSGVMFFNAFYLAFDILGLSAARILLSTIFFVGSLIMGTFFAHPCLKVILASEKITLNSLNSTIIIRYGLLPFAKTITVSADQLTARLFHCDIYQANKAIKPGRVILSLHNKKTDSEFIVASASTKTLVAPVYEKLTEFLKQPHFDELLEEVVFSDGQKIQVSRDSLTGGENAHEMERIFRILSDNSAIFSKDWFNIMMGFGLAAMFIAASIGCLTDRDDATLRGTITVIAMSLVIAAFGVLFAIYSWRTRHIVVEKDCDKILCRSFVKNHNQGKLLCSISDIVAVQVCSILGAVSSGNASRAVSIYEINVVLTNSDNERINIMAGRNSSQIKDDAVSFAEFLGVPFLDHS